MLEPHSRAAPGSGDERVIMPDSTEALAAQAAELARFATDGPRYTSYPTAVEFTEGLDSERHAQLLERADSTPDAPLSLYLHLPFCKSLCSFCGCHAMVARTPERIRRYVELLGREMDLVGRHLRTRRGVLEIHFGGGSPSLLEPADFARVMDAVRSRFQVAAGAAISIEVDPRTTTPAKMRAYRACGVNRISMGFQDLDWAVQQAIGREQHRDVSVRAFTDARDAGFESVNVDLCYGLPGQTDATFDATLAEIARLAPDRVAVFGYAHIPWLRPMQRRIDERMLPSTETRIRLLALGRARLLAAGYRAIGMDHFARPTDELARALDDGTLHRNFQGYTTTRTDTMIGFGISSIGDFGGAMVQNMKSLAAWSQAIEQGRLPTERGVERTREDLLRGHVIREIMCTFGLDVAAVERRFGITFASHFGVEMEDLRRLAADGLVAVTPDGLRLTPLGSVFVRNVAMVFDEYTRARTAARAAGRRFSRTV